MNCVTRNKHTFELNALSTSSSWRGPARRPRKARRGAGGGCGIKTFERAIEFMERAYESTKYMVGTLSQGCAHVTIGNLGDNHCS